MVAAAALSLGTSPPQSCQFESLPSHLDSNSIAGKYTIELFDVSSGMWISHTIDELVPCRKLHDGSYSSVVAKPCGEEIWVPLLEKAMAKHFGGYGGIGSGIQRSVYVYPRVYGVRVGSRLSCDSEFLGIESTIPGAPSRLVSLSSALCSHCV